MLHILTHSFQLLIAVHHSIVPSERRSDPSDLNHIYTYFSFIFLLSFSLLINWWWTHNVQLLNHYHICQDMQKSRNLQTDLQTKIHKWAFLLNGNMVPQVCHSDIRRASPTNKCEIIAHAYFVSSQCPTSYSEFSKSTSTAVSHSTKQGKSMLSFICWPLVSHQLDTTFKHFNRNSVTIALTSSMKHQLRMPR